MGSEGISLEFGGSHNHTKVTRNDFHKNTGRWVQSYSAHHLNVPIMVITMVQIPVSVYQKRMLHRHRVYVPSAGAGGCAIRSLVGTTAAWEE